MFFVELFLAVFSTTCARVARAARTDCTCKSTTIARPFDPSRINCRDLTRFHPHCLDTFNAAQSLAEAIAMLAWLPMQHASGRRLIWSLKAARGQALLRSMHKIKLSNIGFPRSNVHQSFS